MTHTNTHHHNSLHSFFIGTALAFGASGAFAAEEPIKESEFPITRKAICEYNKVPVATAKEYKLCEAFIAERRHKLNDNEKLVAQDATCMSRYKSHHISYYQSCKADLAAHYKVAIPAQPVPAVTQASEKATALEVCAKGAAIGLGTKVAVHTVALIADFLGCAGACTVAATTYTVSATGMVVVGCAGAVVADAVDGDKQSRPVTVPRAGPK